MKIPLLSILSILTLACLGTANASIVFTDNGSGGVTMTVTEQISITLTGSPQGVSTSATVYINLENVYASGATSILTETPGNYPGGFHASIGGIDATAYSTSGQRSTTSGIRDPDDLYIAFTFPFSVTGKGAGDVFILTPGSITLNTAPIPDQLVTTVQLGGITGTTTLSDAVAVIPEPSTSLLCMAGMGVLFRRRRPAAGVRLSR